RSSWRCAGPRTTSARRPAATAGSSGRGTRSSTTTTRCSPAWPSGTEQHPASRCRTRPQAFEVRERPSAATLATGGPSPTDEGADMGIGLGIFLIVVGAILAFAVQDSIANVDLTMIGYICLGAGLLALIIALIVNAQRSNTSHRTVVERRDDGLPPSGSTTTQQTTVRREDPPVV